MPLNARGQEIPDPTPIEIPSGLRRPPSIHDEMKRFIRMELSRQQSEAGLESFEEADDFDLDESEIDDIPTPYMVADYVDMAPENPGGVIETLDGETVKQAESMPPAEAPQEPVNPSA